MEDVVAVVGATGAVGREILRTLERRGFTAEKVLAFASERSAGVTLPFRGAALEVQRLAPDSFEGVTVALFSAGPMVGRELAPVAARSGAVVIDSSSAWRMDPEVPLVVPEVNPQAVMHRPKGIIANPSSGAIQMVVALKPLHDEAKIKRIVVSTYQAASAKGHLAVKELDAQLAALAAGRTPEAQVFPAQLAMNLLNDWKPGADGYSEEELTLVHETRKLLAEKDLAVTPTCVRVPVAIGHGESIHVEFHSPLNARRARELLARAPGIEQVEEPQPVDAANTDSVYVGRIRDDLSVPNALNLWVVADNLRKGAALNAVQIAELVV
jgi:aspartate-semialdehyde dehydrogenase